MSIIYKWLIVDNLDNETYLWYPTDPTLTLAPYNASPYISPASLKSFTQDFNDIPININSASFTLSTIDYFLSDLDNTNGANADVILPDPSNYINRYFVFRKIDSSVFNLVIKKPDNTTIGTLTTQYQSIKFRSIIDSDVPIWELSSVVNSKQEISVYNDVNGDNFITKWQYYNKSTKKFEYEWNTVDPTSTLSSDYVLPIRAVSQCYKYTTDYRDLRDEIFGYTFYNLDVEVSNLHISLPDPNLFVGRYIFIRKYDGGDITIYGAKNLNNVFEPITITTNGITKKFKVVQVSITVPTPSISCYWKEVELSTNDGEDYLNMNGFTMSNKNIIKNADIEARKLKGLSDGSDIDDRKIMIYDDFNNQVNLTKVTITPDGRITNVTNPTQPSDAVTKEYVDNISNVEALGDVIVASTTNYPLSGSGNTFTFTSAPTDIDGILLTDLVSGVDQKKILLKDQTDQTQNGIYLWNGTQLTRVDNFNVGDEVNGVLVNVQFGATNKLKGFICTSPTSADTVGTDDIIFEQFSFFDAEPYLWTFSYAKKDTVDPTILIPELTASDDSWNTLKFNISYDYNNQNTVALNTNEFIIDPGTYMLSLDGLFYGTGVTSIRLINVTDEKIYDYSVSAAPFDSEDPNAIIPILFRTSLNVTGAVAKNYRLEYKVSNINGYIYNPVHVVPTENTTPYDYDPAGPAGKISPSITADEPYYKQSGKGYVLNILKLI